MERASFWKVLLLSACWAKALDWQCVRGQADAPSPAPGDASLGFPAAAAVPSTPAPEPATNGLSPCQAGLNYSSVFMPPQARLAFRLYVSGTRNYTCQTFTLQFGPAMALSRTERDYTCLGYYTSPFVGYIDCAEPGSGRHLGKVTLDTTVPRAVFVAASPDGSATNEPWGRFKITTDGELPPANYVVRYNTTGGVRPAQCTAPRGEWVTVPFTAVQDYFWC